MLHSVQKVFILSILFFKTNYQFNFFFLGLAGLVRGLRTNITLKQLHLQFCNLDSTSGEHLSDLLSFSRSSLEVLNLSGNQLGGKGLEDLCKGLVNNTKLTTLLIADNMIDHVS